jgi:hypothetical protein
MLEGKFKDYLFLQLLRRFLLINIVTIALKYLVIIIVIFNVLFLKIWL